MAFELYTKVRASSAEETISITTAGVLSFSPAATEKYLKNVKAVQLYFDAATKRVGIKPVKEGEKYSYQLFRPKSSKRAAISGRGFLRQYKLALTDKDDKFKPQVFDLRFENGMIIAQVK